MPDWRAWHEGYDDPSSALSQRLVAVQEQIRAFLGRTSPGPVRVVSACSGLGLDVLGAVRDHPRRDDVSGLLVELDAELAARSRTLLEAAGLTGLTVACADAGQTASYSSAVPADLVLLCGVFGNISDEDIRRTATATPRLCAPGATVIWTRHRRAPDLTPSIRAWWEEAGFEELAFVSPGPDTPSVGVCRLVREPIPFEETQLFAFLG